MIGTALADSRERNVAAGSLSASLRRPGAVDAWRHPSDLRYGAFLLLFWRTLSLYVLPAPRGSKPAPASGAAQPPQ